MSAKAKQDLTVGIVIYLFLGWFYWQTTSMLPDSALFPRMILGLFAILNAIMIVQGFRAGKDARAAFSFQDVIIPLIVFLCIVAYVIIFKFIGYFPSTVIMLAGLMIAFKVRPYWLIAVIIIGYCAFIYFLFVKQLNVSLL